VIITQRKPKEVKVKARLMKKSYCQWEQDSLNHWIHWRHWRWL